MNIGAGRVLVVGDPETLVVLAGLAPLEGCELEGCHGESEALRRLRRGGHDVVVTGRSTSLEEDLAFLDDARAARPGVRGIVIVPSAERAGGDRLDARARLRAVHRAVRCRGSGGAWCRARSVSGTGRTISS